MGRALRNGVTREELAEVATHLAFYAGWPAGMSAVTVLADIDE
jgi:4-carboxymuconolactone decarboxylase